MSPAWIPGSGIPKPTIVEFDAIWDTGASNSVITQTAIDECGLVATGMAQVHGVHGVKSTETYLVNIALPDNVVFTALRVTKGEIRGADILIGMDIINKGDFSVTNCDGHSQFSYRTPSIEHIDYVAQAKAIQQPPQAQPQTRAERRRAMRGRA